MRRRSGPAGIARWAVLLLVLSAACSSGSPKSERTPSQTRSGVVSPAPSPSTPPDPPAPGPLSASGSAWAGHGDLAFVSRGALEVLTNSGQLQAIGGPSGGTDSNPRWSADHKWLAFINSTSNAGQGTGNPTLWRVAAGATTAAQLATSTVDAFAWSPSGETLAFTTAPPANSTPPPTALDTLWVLAGTEAARALTGPTVTGGLAWSPDGSELAFGGWSPSPASPAVPAAGSYLLQVIPAGGGSPATWVTVSNAEVLPVGWWPDGGGVVYWQQGIQGNGFLDDGVPTYSVAQSGQSKLLATMMEVPSWLAWSANGTLALVAGGGRQIWGGGKQVDTCTVATGSCRPVEAASGSVTLSPGWLSATTLTYVSATASGPFGPNGAAHSSAGWMAQWDGTHSLQVSSTASSAPGTLGGTGPGVVAYTWAANGSSLLYVRDDAVWLLSTASTAPAVRVAGPLLSTAAPSGYYGVVDWAGTYAWTGGPPPSTVLFGVVSDEYGG